MTKHKTKADLHAELATIASRAYAIDLDRSRGYAPTPIEIAALRGALMDVTARVVDVIGALVDDIEIDRRERNEPLSPPAKTLVAMGSMATRELRAGFERLRDGLSDDEETLVMQCLFARDRLMDTCLGIEAEFSRALGRPSALMATRRLVERRLARRETARRGLADRLREVCIAPGDDVEVAKSINATLASALLRAPLLAFDRGERRTMKALCERVIEMIWSLAPADRHEVAAEIVEDTRAFAAVLEHDTHAWPEQAPAAA